MRFFNQIPSFISVCLLSTGFKCSSSGNSSQASLEAANVGTETLGPQLKGLLRLRVEQLAVFYIDRLDEDTVTDRAEEMTVDETISSKDDAGNDISNPVVYVELTGMTLQ